MLEQLQLPELILQLWSHRQNAHVSSGAFCSKVFFTVNTDFQNDKRHIFWDFVPTTQNDSLEDPRGKIAWNSQYKSCLSFIIHCIKQTWIDTLFTEDYGNETHVFEPCFLDFCLEAQK